MKELRNSLWILRIFWYKYFTEYSEGARHFSTRMCWFYCILVWTIRYFFFQNNFSGMLLIRVQVDLALGQFSIHVIVYVIGRFGFFFFFKIIRLWKFLVCNWYQPVPTRDHQSRKKIPGPWMLFKCPNGYLLLFSCWV